MKKSHPIRRVVLAGAATVSGIVLLLSLKPSTDPTSAQAAGAAPQAGAAAQESPQGGTAQQTGTQTVTGSVVQTEYGNVQVQITMADGKITKAAAVQAPKGGTSDQKTALAVPKLNQEAVAKQSADIDVVSTATYTSNGYKQSLQSAIDKAKAAAPAASASSGSSDSGSTQARTVTGDVAQTTYGNVQVRLTLSGDKITKAEAVQAPSGGTSDQKTALAVPKLNQEVVTAQSADIDAVSTATYTSNGYKQSLQSALDKAGV
ncbi:FMN-binding domain protein [Actinobacteria bacterium OK074]|nr:FMN-binding domain protein [Actinobacteria bacterium OK074]